MNTSNTCPDAIVVLHVGFQRLDGKPDNAPLEVMHAITGVGFKQMGDVRQETIERGDEAEYRGIFVACTMPGATPDTLPSVLTALTRRLSLDDMGVMEGNSPENSPPLLQCASTTYLRVAYAEPRAA